MEGEKRLITDKMFFSMDGSEKWSASFSHAIFKYSSRGVRSPHNRCGLSESAHPLLFSCLRPHIIPFMGLVSHDSLVVVAFRCREQLNHSTDSEWRHLLGLHFILELGIFLYIPQDNRISRLIVCHLVQVHSFIPSLADQPSLIRTPTAYTRYS